MSEQSSVDRTGRNLHDGQREGEDASRDTQSCIVVVEVQFRGCHRDPVGTESQHDEGEQRNDAWTVMLAGKRTHPMCELTHLTRRALWYVPSSSCGREGWVWERRDLRMIFLQTQALNFGSSLAVLSDF